jgi:ribosomal protein L37E
MKEQETGAVMEKFVCPRCKKKECDFEDSFCSHCGYKFIRMREPGEATNLKKQVNKELEELKHMLPGSNLVPLFILGDAVKGTLSWMLGAKGCPADTISEVLRQVKAKIKEDGGS